jgi:hypothetical protein
VFSKLKINPESISHYIKFRDVKYSALVEQNCRP